MPTQTRDRQAPWPQQTPSPALAFAPPSRRRRRSQSRSLANHVEHRIDSRDGDIIADEAEVEAEMEQCQLFSGNDVTTCFPNSTIQIPQHQFASFVWNSRLPQFLQTNLVNIYLLSATEQNPSHQDVILQWNSVVNPTGQAGVWRTQVNDTWWGDRGNEWDGTNLPFLFQWAITRADKTLDGSVSSLPVFTALQTTFADSVLASMSSTSAAAAASSASASASSASASAAAASSASAAAASSRASGGLSGSTNSDSGVNPSATSTASGGSGNVQSAASSSFPHWAIAVIVVLGFLALVASGVLAFFMIRRMRRRRNSTLSHRGSMGSSTPMMRNAETGEPTSPVVASAYGATASHHRPASPEIHDGASTMSRTSDAALFSGADAAVMADAFRAALRKPNFASRPVEEGESPGSDPLNPSGSEGNDLHTTDPGLLGELAEEGRDIRSVGSSRGVKVETLSDAADRDTLHDLP